MLRNCRRSAATARWLLFDHIWSAWLSRRLSLYSHAAVDFWAMMESYASVLTFCEYPGLVLVDQKPRIADFALRRDDLTEFVIVEATPLTAIDAELLEILDPLPVTAVNADVPRSANTMKVEVAASR
jgi:hypothetical protein